MENTREITKLAKWGNGQGICLSEKIMNKLNFQVGSDLLVDIQKTPSGKKQLIIPELDAGTEPSIEEKLTILDSLQGILADTNIPKDIDIKQERNARRIKKYLGNSH